jgi:hypothetical protein
MEQTCRYCTWWVEETGDYQDFQHYQAVKENKGFCLVQDLFTMKESDDECDCGEFNHE